MSVLTTLPPQFSISYVAGIADTLYGLSGGLTPLDSERDQNFRLTASDGTDWVLKIANAAEDHQALAFQAALLRHVQTVDPALPLPHLRPTLAGEDLGRTGVRGGAACQPRRMSGTAGPRIAELRPSRRASRI